MPLPFLLGIGAAIASGAAAVGTTAAAVGTAAAGVAGAVGTAATAVGATAAGVAGAVGTAATAVGATAAGVAGAVGTAATAATTAVGTAAAGVAGVVGTIAASPVVTNAVILGGTSALISINNERIADENYKKGYNNASKVYEAKLLDQAKMFEKEKEKILSLAKESLENKDQLINDCLVYINALEKEVAVLKANHQPIPSDYIKTIKDINSLRLDLMYS